MPVLSKGQFSNQRSKYFSQLSGTLAKNPMSPKPETASGFLTTCGHAGCLGLGAASKVIGCQGSHGLHVGHSKLLPGQFVQVSDGNTDSELRIYFCNLTGYFTIQEPQTPDLNEGNPDHQKAPWKYGENSPCSEVQQELRSDFPRIWGLTPAPQYIKSVPVPGKET